jgi:FtsH-binding integral membrane protein
MIARNLAWLLWAATVLLVGGALVLGLANRQEVPLFDAPLTIIPPTFATLGALISSRRPGNVMGWIFLATGILGGVQMFSGQYATVALAPDGLALPGSALAAWCAMLAQNSFPVSILFLVLLFPDGMLPSRRWRPLAWAMGVFLATTLVVGALSPGPFPEFPSVSNPFGVEGAKPSGSVLAAGQLGGLACVIATLLSLIVRFYFSRGEERLQLKWFTYAAVVGLSTPLLLSSLAPAVFQMVGPFAWTLGFLSLPVSAGLAVLKYRLYDIDRIINSTLVYGALTVTLVGVYVGSVVSIQYAFRALTGSRSPLAIVASTLLIAALFNPLRRRVQNFIDHRFYRRKYDAAKTLEAFSAKLRDETDIDALNSELLSTVRETMQPEHASLWLREPERKVER